MKKMEKSIRALRVKTNSDLDERILADASAALAKSSKERPTRKQTHLGGLIMKSNWTKFAAAAAAIIVVAVVLVTVLEKSPTSAYALEQTIQANHSVRTIHIKKFTPSNEQPEEFWAEFYESGELYRCRMNMPKTADGPKEIVWREDRAEIWQESKNLYAIIRDKSVSEHLRELIGVIDPKLAIQNLHQLQAEGKVQIEIAESSQKGAPIRVTATYMENSRQPGRRVILTVDSTTKLVGEIEHYQLSKDDYQFQGRLEIQDYNRPINPATFTLNVPADAVRIDQTAQEVGLAQGNLSDEKIAVKVVREFLEALIAKNYAKASQLYQGVPPEFLKKQLAGKNFVRIVSIGEPKPSKWNDRLIVPCEYEVEVNGEKTVVKSNPFVRRVFGQADHWTIDGGI